MMGHREKLSANEWDAFSRKSRRLMRWGRGEIRKLKRAFAKRVRQQGRVQPFDADLET
jgi:hypothetical protein